MRIGHDIDGVYANFARRFSERLVAMFGNKFPEDMDWDNPPKWDWFFPYYTKEEVRACFLACHSDPFWYHLEPHHESISTLALVIEEMEHKHDVYFATNRGGAHAKRETERWLRLWLPYRDSMVGPTVLITGNKGAMAKALDLDVYIDDNLDNAIDVLRQSPKTRVYLLDRAYNQGAVELYFPEAPNFWTEHRKGTRVPSVAAMLDLELPNL